MTATSPERTAAGNAAARRQPLLVMKQLRAYHATLAVLVVASYFITDWGHVHQWLGYTVVLVIAVRLGMAFSGAPQLGLMRFYPHFHGLKLDNIFTHPAISQTLLMGIAVCLIGVSVTGVMLDQGRTLGLGSSSQTEVAVAESTEGEEGDEAATPAGRREESPVAEAHEVLANVLIGLVAAHVAYLLLFKRQIALFMLFFARPQAAAKPAVSTPARK